MRLKTLKIIFGVLITVWIISGIAYALTTIWSNEVQVEVQNYILTLNVDSGSGSVNSTFTFTGALSLGGSGVSGKTVELYKDNVATGLTNVTAVDGSYSIMWSTSQNGTYTFKTKAEW